MCRRVAILGAAVATALLAGCASQIAGLAPVAGDTRAAIRTAAIDVLLQQKLTIRLAPECTDVGDGYSCVGSLTDGSAIVVSAPGADPTTMTVLVGDVVAYEGSIQDVLDEAARRTG